MFLDRFAQTRGVAIDLVPGDPLHRDSLLPGMFEHRDGLLGLGFKTHLLEKKASVVPGKVIHFLSWYHLPLSRIPYTGQERTTRVLDSTAAVTRDARRRGLGWLAGQADIGWSNRVGWDEGFHLLLCVTAEASDSWLRLRQRKHARSASGWFPVCGSSYPVATLARCWFACSRLVCGRERICRESAQARVEATIPGGSDHSAASEKQAALPQSLTSVAGPFAANH